MEEELYFSENFEDSEESDESVHMSPTNFPDILTPGLLLRNVKRNNKMLDSINFQAQF